MNIKQAIVFIDNFLEEYTIVLQNKYDRNINESTHNKRLTEFLNTFYDRVFHMFLSPSLELDGEDKRLEKQLSKITKDKCFYIEKRKGVKWGYGVESNKDIAFFCYMGGGEPDVKNLFVKLKILAIFNKDLRIVAEMRLDIKTFREKKIISWKKNLRDPLVEMGYCIEDDGLGKVVDLVKIESPTGFQPHIDHYNNVSL